MKIASIAGLGTILLLTSCAEKWMKPGGTQQEFMAMEADCTSRAFSSYPPLLRQRLVSPGYVTPPRLICEDIGYFQRCLPYEGEYIEPVVATVDANDPGRSSNVRSCFFKNGWRPATN